jgi:hypothetical protein
MITLHLKGRTLGQQAFNVTLTGPGARSTNDWVAPRLDVREASKQRGRLLIVPEAGIRLQATRREGVTQTDPAESGVRQKGVLAFRLLQDDWTLAFNVEQIDAWIQVTGLQQVTFGVRSFRLRLPTAADGVRFHGDNIADFSRGAADPATGLSEWEVKLERRVMGAALLRVTYSLPLPEPASEVVIAGIEALDANVQRGFVTLQTGGRLQAQADPPPALQATEWQTIPRFLQQDGAAIPTAHAFRMVEPAFRLPVRLNRHEAAPVLPARVSSVELTSVVSDNGDALTRARIRLAPGDKRLLAMTLPEGARFWFAFVNENSVWPWQATNQWLIPLERSARPQDESVVEFFYSSEAGQGGRASLNLNLEGPRLDLPLEDITWVVFLNDRWRIHEWDGTLTLRDEALTGASPGVDLSAYIQREAEARQQKSREAEEFLNLANSLLARGEPQQARRAFEAAYGMSQHDMAFNEDARVQLNNLKVQQALVGMNVRQARVAGAAEAIAAAPRDLLEDRGAYTQTQARELLGRKSAEESEAEARLAERLIQQQEAAVGSPAAIRASIPEQGRRVVFSKPVEVNPWSDLRVRIEARAEPEAGWTRKLGWLALLFIGAFAARASVRAR